MATEKFFTVSYLNYNEAKQVMNQESATPFESCRMVFEGIEKDLTTKV